MVTCASTPRQSKLSFPTTSTYLTRRQQHRAKQQAQTLLRALREVLAPADFDLPGLTQFGAFAVFEAFKWMVGFPQLLAEHLTLPKGANSQYSGQEIVELLVDANVLGVSRFEAIDDVLRYDTGLHAIKGVSHLPSERTCRHLLARLQPGHLEQLRRVHQALLRCKAATEAPREVWVNYDTSVIPVFGEQEGAERGYNPRYPGRLCLQMRVASVHGTGELLHCELDPGKTRPLNNFLTFHAQAQANLPPTWVLRGVRADSGFFDDRILTQWEDECLYYVVKAPLKKRLQQAITYLERHGLWQELDDTWAVAELRLPLSGWARARRFVFVRQRQAVDPKTGQYLFTGPGLDRYQVIVTNLEEESPEEVWRAYNQRATIEPEIDEIKDDLAVGEVSQHALVRNRAYTWIKVLAYNLLNWFRIAALPEYAQSQRAARIREKLLRVPALVVGEGRYRRIRFGPNPRLRSLLQAVQERLRGFAFLAAAYLMPMRC